MINEINESLEGYGNNHEKMHSESLEYSFEIVNGIYVMFIIGKIGDSLYSRPAEVVRIEEYKELYIGLVYNNGAHYSPWSRVKLKRLYDETYENDSSPFEFIFDGNLKPYQIIEKLSNLIKENPQYQDLIKKL